MKLYGDCEFNGWCGDLISIALVDEAGREFYKVLELPTLVDQWVAINVLPVLGNVRPEREAKVVQALAEFLSAYDSVHIVTDWPDDVRYICGLLITGPGKRIDTPPLTIEIVRLDGKSETPHNALADAHALREVCMLEERPERRAEAFARDAGLLLWRRLSNAFEAGARFVGADYSDRLLAERLANQAEGYAADVVRTIGLPSPVKVVDKGAS